MKKLTALLTALLLPAAFTVTALADKIDYPADMPYGAPVWLFIVIALLLVGIAAALFFIIRAAKKKK